jgi:hypothetical protein
MPRNAEDVENFLYRLNRTFDREDNGMFIVSSGVEGPPIAVRVVDPIVVVRVDIGKVPDGTERQAKVFRQLLEYNGSDLVHSSYCLEGDEIILSAGLELENIDENELAAVLSDIDLALVRHVPILHELAA